jgi:hypothetical protein
MMCCKLDNEDTLTMMLLSDHILDDKMLTEEFAEYLKISIQKLNILSLKLKIHFNIMGESNATCQDSAHEKN